MNHQGQNAVLEDDQARFSSLSAPLHPYSIIFLRRPRAGSAAPMPMVLSALTCSGRPASHLPYRSAAPTFPRYRSAVLSWSLAAAVEIPRSIQVPVVLVCRSLQSSERCRHSPPFSSPSPLCREATCRLRCLKAHRYCVARADDSRGHAWRGAQIFLHIQERVVAAELERKSTTLGQARRMPSPCRPARLLRWPAAAPVSLCRLPRPHDSPHPLHCTGVLPAACRGHLRHRFPPLARLRRRRAGVGAGHAARAAAAHRGPRLASGAGRCCRAACV